MGDHFEVLDEGGLMAPLDSSTIKSNLSVPGIQGCHENDPYKFRNELPLHMSVCQHQHSFGASLNPEAGPKGIMVLTYRGGGHFEALDEGVLLVLLDPRYTHVGFNHISVQVWNVLNNYFLTFQGVTAISPR